jgi:hypothetical protein
MRVRACATMRHHLPAVVLEINESRWRSRAPCEHCLGRPAAPFKSGLGRAGVAGSLQRLRRVQPIGYRHRIGIRRGVEVREHSQSKIGGVHIGYVIAAGACTKETDGHQRGALDATAKGAHDTLQKKHANDTASASHRSILHPIDQEMLALITKHVTFKLLKIISSDAPAAILRTRGRYAWRGAPPTAPARWSCIGSRRARSAPCRRSRPIMGALRRPSA